MNEKLQYSDTEMLEWIMDALFGDRTDAKMELIAGAILLHKTDRDVLIEAMLAERKIRSNA